MYDKQNVSHFISETFHMGLVLRILTDGNGLQRIPIEELIQFTSDNNYISFVGMENPRRFGVLLFHTAIEMKCFIPGTPLNELFQIHKLKWNDIIYSVITIPNKYMDEAMMIAEKSHLRISNGIITMMTKDGIELFPLKTKNVYSFQNKIESNPFEEDLHEIENRLCEDIMSGKITEIPNEWIKKYSE